MIDLIKKLKELKNELKKDGFIIDALFGSSIKNYQQAKDIDLLYHLEEPFFKNYEGFKGFKKLEEIKQYLQQQLNKEVDLAPKDNLSKTSKKYILKDIIYV